MSGMALKSEFADLPIHVCGLNTIRLQYKRIALPVVRVVVNLSLPNRQDISWFYVYQNHYFRRMLAFLKAIQISI